MGKEFLHALSFRQMVMEYCDAGTLKQLLAIDLSEAQIANIAKQAYQSLRMSVDCNRCCKDWRISIV